MTDRITDNIQMPNQVKEKNCQHKEYLNFCEKCGTIFLKDGPTIQKPDRFDYVLELHPKEILRLMVENTADFTIHNEKITSIKKYLEKRKFLIDILRCLKEKLKFRSQTLYLAIYYMDIINITGKEFNSSPELIAISCLLISSKFDENDPDIPDLQNFQTIFSKKQNFGLYFTMHEIKRSEVNCLIALNYKLNYFSVYHFLVFFFIHGVVSNEELKEFYLKSKFSEKLSDELESNLYSINIKVIEKLYAFSREILDVVTDECNLEISLIKSHFLAIGLITYAKEIILQVDNGSNENNSSNFDIFKSFYEIDFVEYENSYNLIKSVCEKFNKKKADHDINDKIDSNSNKVISNNVRRESEQRKFTIPNKIPKLENKARNKGITNELIESNTISSKLLKLEKLKYEKVNLINKGRPHSSQKIDRKNDLINLSNNINTLNKINELKLKTIDQENSYSKREKEKEISDIKKVNEIKKNEKISIPLPTNKKELRTNKKFKTELIKNTTINKQDDKQFKNLDCILHRKDDAIKLNNQVENLSKHEKYKKSNDSQEIVDDVYDILDITKKIFSKNPKYYNKGDLTSQTKENLTNDGVLINKNNPDSNQNEDKHSTKFSDFPKVEKNEISTKNSSANPSTIIINNNINFNTFINYDYPVSNYDKNTKNINIPTQNHEIKTTKLRRESYNISRGLDSYNIFDAYSGLKYDLHKINQSVEKKKIEEIILNKMNKVQIEKRNNFEMDTRNNIYNNKTHEKDSRKNFENKVMSNNYNYRINRESRDTRDQFNKEHPIPKNKMNYESGHNLVNRLENIYTNNNNSMNRGYSGRSNIPNSTEAYNIIKHYYRK